MSQVISDPAEIRRFQAALRQFNSEVSASTNRIRAQLHSLGSAWRDQEYARFSQELEAVIRSFERYLQSADGYLQHLENKARPLEEYLIGELQAYLAATPPAAAPASPPPLPSAAAGAYQGGAGGGTWVDTGIQMVDLDQIDMSNSPVTSWDDFRKVSPQEMQEGLRKLQDVVAPAVAQGANDDYFLDMDDAQHLDYANGYLRIYEAFYGNDCIRLNKVGDRYQVVNGYHRLFLARQMGIKALPARVIAPRS